MAVVCIVRPKRSAPRHFTAKDAARIICYAIRSGSSWQKIKEEAREKCVSEVEDCDCEKLKQTIKNYERIMQLALSLIAIAVPILAGIRALVAIRAVKEALKTLRKEDQRALENSSEAEKLLRDGSRIIEGEFTVLKTEVETLFGAGRPIIIKE